jgi:hypothetical protein
LEPQFWIAIGKTAFCTTMATCTDKGNDRVNDIHLVKIAITKTNTNTMIEISKTTVTVNMTNDH